MRVLLDTCVYLWWLENDPKLSSKARDVVQNPLTLVHVSAATVWEISIKQKLGRLTIGKSDVVAEIEANGFVALSISPSHAYGAGSLPRYHDDPFDRMLVAQALAEQMTLITRDRPLRRYGVDLLLT